MGTTDHNTTVLMEESMKKDSKKDSNFDYNHTGGDHNDSQFQSISIMPDTINHSAKYDSKELNTVVEGPLSTTQIDNPQPIFSDTHLNLI